MAQRQTLAPTSPELSPTTAMSDLDDDPSVSLDTSPLNNPDEDDHNTPDREDDGTSTPAPAPFDPPAAPAPTGRRGQKRKKPMPRKQRDLLEKKLQLLKDRLRPVPFISPAKSLDLGRHEGLFRRLGLWEFAHIALDREIREDLLQQLVAGYNSGSRSSSVEDFRIKVSRADLARALNLPVKKKEKAVVVDVHDLETATDRAALAAVEDFVSYYVLLHEEDTWMMPDEVSNWVKVIREGQPHKLDVAGLIWFMVEKELSQGQQLEFCYYASHLQHLMRFQRPELFFKQDEVLPDEDDKKEKETADAEMEEAEIEVFTTSVADVKMQEAVDDEARDTELSLGFDNGDDDQEQPFMRNDDRVELEECKEEETYHDWGLRGKMSFNNVGEHLRRCDSLNMNVEEEDERFEMHQKFVRLDSLRSSDLIQDMGGNDGSFNIPMDLIDHQSSGLMGSKMDLLKGMPMSSLNHGGPLLFENSVGRGAHEDDGAPHFSCGDPSANIGIDVPWDNRFSSFDTISNQAQASVLKLVKIHAQKVEECHNALMQVQSLDQDRLVREQYIQSLEENKKIELTKKELELQHYQKELGVVTELLHGYKMALRTTQKAFADYREKHNQAEDSIYKDVDDSYKDVDDPPGLVLSIDDLDKLRLKKEEERRIKRCLAEELVKKFEQEWNDRFGELSERVELLAIRFNKVEAVAVLVIRKIDVSKPLSKSSQTVD